MKLNEDELNFRQQTMRNEQAMKMNECAVGGGLNPHYRPPSIVDRAHKTLAAVQSNQEREAVARRIVEIAEKHPDIVELLDLIQRM